jgi:phospholipid/cholesterol/gamma-HCH transport system ATP-binding protein
MTPPDWSEAGDDLAIDGRENPHRDPVISMQDVHKRFGSKVVLNGIDLDVQDGEVVVIMGPSGTGKSVLLRHIVGLTRPERGKVVVFGHDLHGLPRETLYDLRLQIGVLFQGAALLDSMNVLENIVLGLRNHRKLPDNELQEIAASKLEQVGLSGIGRLMPAELSGGMRKRVGLARAIAMEPRIILYDEPTTGLDPVNSDVINELIVKVATPLTTSIIVTHDMASAFRVGNRFVMLLGGKIVFDGDAAALRSSDDPRVAGFITGKAETLDLLT